MRACLQPRGDEAGARKNVIELRFAQPNHRSEGSLMQALGQIRQIDYTVIFARDMPAMRHFYEKTMEFPLLRVLSERWVGNVLEIYAEI